ncbi:ParA family protein [Crocosphaera sp. UHCC 0190]|uniref:ParA family protein n=1 Tax=Crocosphaera sp. UHCC 0190 TaxID=3110246 RepID=UPI002B1F8F0C|nr:ParA family protein [Crocosphaera sp. UHCC 0190]MEA5512304.1 ParA family protein [Crocosphaera sp. UHCC 0190]
MIITVTSYKGGVGKTTTAIHLACYLQQQGRDTLLVDGDPNRSSLAWEKRGSLPIKVVDERSAPKYIRDYENIVIDTSARPETEELQALADGCDLLLLPTTPDAMAIDALSLTVNALKTIGVNHYKVLLTIIPPKPTRDGEEAREFLTDAGIPLFKKGIRRLIVFQRAALQGVPVYEVSDRSSRNAWNDYVAVGKELING